MIKVRILLLLALRWRISAVVLVQQDVEAEAEGDNVTRVPKQASNKLTCFTKVVHFKMVSPNSISRIIQSKSLSLTHAIFFLTNQHFYLPRQKEDESTGNLF